MLPIPALDSGVCWKEQNKGSIYNESEFSLFCTGYECREWDVLVDNDSFHIKDQVWAFREQMIEASKKRGAIVCSVE